ncbi:2-isopropylmalate synthase [Thiohalocapsa marina]|uniref:2-isopropylmalate synthase n=1 Tax=Thiohalocapsa marina TaxID=424902 RepID=A0A5M8FDG5_9GAMM|nr:2-isopropylmalate synthase [Thiohalocapsa marina]KAA6182923.1 2-isopropylmalate synthase [Thiohalocapsa marina]
MPYDHRKYHRAPAVQLPDRQWPDRIITQAPRWASVDLRDGNQALRSPMSVAQKRRLWALLLEIGVKEIEVGFPSASQPDYDFVRWLIEEQQIPDDVTVQVLVQAREDLIQRTFAALDGVPRAIVHVYNSTSPVQREWVFGADRAGIKSIAVRGAELLAAEAARYPGTDWTFQYSPESFSQTEPDYAVEVCNAVLDVWQPTPERPCILNLPATVESASPNVFADQVEGFCRALERSGRRDSVIVSLHTHNDRGGAVAAAELGLLAGADRVEGTLLGNGERTGNMDMVTLAMNLYSQGVDPGLDLSRPDAIIGVVEECTGIACHPRHPWVGELVYTAFSGSHQDAINKSLKHQRADSNRGEPWRVAYLPIDPADLGRSYEAVIRVNSQSGKGGIAFVLEREYGLSLPRWLQQALAPIVQRASEERGGIIDAETIRGLFLQHFVRDRAPAELRGYRLSRNGRDRLEVRVAMADAAGGDGGQTEYRITGDGEGAIAAFADAWGRFSGQPVNVIDYQEHAIGAGTDAEAAAYVLLDVDGVQVAGAAIDRDTVAASLKAVLSALNRGAEQGTADAGFGTAVPKAHQQPPGRASARA